MKRFPLPFGVNYCLSTFLNRRATSSKCSYLIHGGPSSTKSKRSLLEAAIIMAFTKNRDLWNQLDFRNENKVGQRWYDLSGPTNSLIQAISQQMFVD